MKKSLLALAVLGTFGGAAFAQSTVTLYGVADAYYQNVDNGPKTVNRVDSGGLSGSRIGVRGSEDLGNGTSAIFTIEGGINLDDGTNGQGAVWGRQAFVGLKSGSFGQATIGRHQTPLYDIVVNYGGAGNGQSIGASTNVFSFTNGNPYVPATTTDATVGPNPQSRINNSIKYISPNFAGLTLTAFVGFGENTTTNVKTTAGNTLAAAAEYKIGQFAASALYQESKATPVAFAQADKTRTFAVGASYNLGVAKPFVFFQDNKSSQFRNFGVAPNNFTGKAISGYIVDLGVAAPLGAGSLTVDYGFVNSRVDQGVIGDNGDAKSAGLRYDYSLSKRTTAYAGVQKIWNEGQSAYALTGTSGISSAALRGQDPRSIFLGARHTF